MKSIIFCFSLHQLYIFLKTLSTFKSSNFYPKRKQSDNQEEFLYNSLTDQKFDFFKIILLIIFYIYKNVFHSLPFTASDV